MKYYLIRILQDNKLQWAYLEHPGGHKEAYSRAQELFGTNLRAFEPGNVIRNLKPKYKRYK